MVITDNNSEKLFHALDEGADDVVHWAESEHEGYLYERTLDVCHDGVDAAIDFVRYAHSLPCGTIVVVVVVCQVVRSLLKTRPLALSRARHSQELF